VAREAGLSTVETAVPLADLRGYPAAIVTNAVVPVRPVAAIDDRPLDADAPPIAALRAAYEALPGDLLAP
jgi:branched-subunit amino acid aminotransferase/4-amino-4-deoxychorismate lyase